MAPKAKTNLDPWIKRSTLRFLTRGETPSVRAVSLQLHLEMVIAIREGDGTIHATWREVSEWAGVSYASVKRAVSRLRDLGWVKELPGGRIVFDYRRSASTNMAQIEPSPYMEEKTLREGMNHPEDQPSVKVAELPPSGEDAALKAKKAKGDKRKNLGSLEAERPSMMGQAIASLVEAGADRAGAVAAVRRARKAGSLSLEAVQRIAAAVQALPTKPFKPAALLCAAVARPELAAKLLRDQTRGSKKISITHTESVGHVIQQASVDTSASNSGEARRRKVRGWLELLDLGDAEDRALLAWSASQQGWTPTELQVVFPELKAVTLPSAHEAEGHLRGRSPLY